MEFCPNCGKIILPRHNTLNCSNCGYKKVISEDNKGEYVIEEELLDNKELIIIDKKVNAMPTTRGLCYKCHNRELEWWMVQTRKADEATTIFYRCTKCGNTWRR
jgi:DNA-directed RNA polymerase subunit M